MIDKVDLLYLCLGTNPFPNIIAAVTRVKDKGEIICLCTKETKDKPYIRFKKLLVDRLKMNVIVSNLLVDTVDINDIANKIEANLNFKLEEKQEDTIIEINYTGGTKVMSSTAYNIIRNYSHRSNYSIKTILSYIDAEREELYYEYRENKFSNFNHSKVKLSGLSTKYELSVYDIISTYNNIEVINEKKVKIKLDNEELSIKLGNLFKDIDKETYNARIELFEKIHRITKESKSDVDTKLNLLFQNNKIDIEFHSFEELNFKNKKEGIEYFKKFIWLEEYIFSILLELKDEKVLKDVKGNIEKKENIKENSFEIDIVAYRKYKLFAISVTALDNVSDAKGKLYEIRQRAKDLAGDEAGMCYINLCWNTEELENEYRNIWDDFKVKNTLIIGADRFSTLKEELKKWILGGEKHE